MIAIVVGVVVVAGGAAFFLLKGGGDSDDPGPVDTGNLASPVDPGGDVQPVHFALRDTTTEATVTTSKADKAQVKAAAKDIRDTLANMYTLAFVDPANWKEGNYDDVFVFFQPGQVATSAEHDVATLTLGPDAGETFDEVTQKYSGLRVKILTDKDGAPFTAAATADFSADAKTKDGSPMLIKSHATYYLQHGEGGWVIVAYKAKRLDGGSGGKGGGNGNGGNAPTTAPTTASTSGASQ